MAKTLAALALGLALGEGAARLVTSSPTILDRIASPHDEPSWRLRWIARQTDGATLRLSFDIHHPIRGWAVKPNLKNLPVFGDKSLTTNALGIRSDRDLAVPKPAGLVRLVFLGDSFTFGEDVSDHETFSFQLQQLLDPSRERIEVVNLGVHGYGHDQMLLYLREVLPVVEPDVVVVGYVTDDSLRNLTAFRDYAKPRFRLVDGRLELVGVPVPDPDAFLRSQRWHSRLADLLTMLGTRIAWSTGARFGTLDALTDALLSQIASETRAAGARPALALLPAWNELGVTDPAPLPAEQFVLDLARRETIPALRLRPAFVELARLGAQWDTRGHWGPNEHRLAARGILDFLRREALLDASGTAQ